MTPKVLPAIGCVVGTKDDFKPRSDDIFQERLYAIQWITKETIHQPRQETFFTGVNEADLVRERKVERS